MLALLSPAKKIDLEAPLPTQAHSQADTLAHTEALLPTVRSLSADDLARLMDISADLASLNHTRFQALSMPFSPSNARPAAMAFAGDVYQALDAKSLTEADLLWSQQHAHQI